MKKGLKILGIATLAVASLLGCRPAEQYPDPTDEFYVNDFANVLPSAVEHTIVVEGEELYAETDDDETLEGAQIVFATFAVDIAEDIAAYDRSDLFNQWGIGRNDMGILVVLFYVGDADKPEELVLTEVQIEIGYQMEIYLTPGEAGEIVDETILTDASESIGVVHLLYALLDEVYRDVYGYTGLDYDMEEYQTFLDSYDPYSDYDSIWGWILYVVLSPFSGWWEKGVLVVIGLVILGAGGGIVKNIGGGGRSGGMGIRRRR